MDIYDDIYSGFLFSSLPDLLFFFLLLHFLLSFIYFSSNESMPYSLWQNPWCRLTKKKKVCVLFLCELLKWKILPWQVQKNIWLPISNIKLLGHWKFKVAISYFCPEEIYLMLWPRYWHPSTPLTIYMLKPTYQCVVLGAEAFGC